MTGFLAGIKKGFHKKAVLIGVNFSILYSFFSTLFMPSVVFAASKSPAQIQKEGKEEFEKYAPSSGKSGVESIPKLIYGFIPTVQGFAAACLVLFGVICGFQIGASAITQDPRSRAEAIRGLVYIVIAGIVVIHAQQIVGMAAGMS